MVVASILLAKAFFSAGYYVQTFPVFGVERRGAPVEAYLRLDKKKILLRCNVYTPNHAVVQDVKLLDSVDVTAGLKSGGWILVNAPGQPANLAAFSGFHLSCVDAIASGKHAAMALDTYFARGTDAVEQRLAGCRVGAGPALSMAVYLGKDRKNRTACCSDQCVPAVRSRRRYSLYPEFQRRSKGERIFYKPGPV